MTTLTAWGVDRRCCWCFNLSHIGKIIYISFCQFLISLVPQNWSTTKALAMCTCIIKNSERWKEPLWSYFLALHLESGRVEGWGKKEKKHLSEKHHLQELCFFLNAPNITSSSINVFTAFLTRSLCKPTDYITLPSLMGV